MASDDDANFAQRARMLPITDTERRQQPRVTFEDVKVQRVDLVGAEVALVVATRRNPRHLDPVVDAENKGDNIVHEGVLQY